MDKKEIYGIVKDKIVELSCVDNNKITEESLLVSDLGWDSLEVIELIIALEEKFDINISDEAAEKIVCVKDIVNTVYSMKEAKEK